MIERLRKAAYPFFQQGKLVATLGGEHSVSIGLVKALVDRYADPWGPEGLSVLYLDAHADLRDEYMGTGWGHASVARRISEICPMVQVGVRSFSLEEKEFIRDERVNTFFWPPLQPRSHQRKEVESLLPPLWGRTEVGGRESPPSRPSPIKGEEDFPAKREGFVQEIIGLLSRDVYISVDLDVFDPAIMSAVGTPEPGGMDWYQVTSLLRAVAEERHIVGFDVTELSPGEGPTACAYTAAKLVYKLVAYATLLGSNR